MALESSAKEQSLFLRSTEQMLESAGSYVDSCTENDFESQEQVCDTNTETRTFLHMFDKQYAQSSQGDCSSSVNSSIPKQHRYESTSGCDLVLYNEMCHYSGAVPSYCEMQLDGEVQTSVAPPVALRPCASTTSVVSCAKSDTNSSILGPTCRICDSAGDGCNRLISPCRCSGTSKFVHEQCLNKWLETINAQSDPRCEVCCYHIHTRKVYRLRNWRMPEVSNCDMALHLVFIAAISVLIVSAAFTMIGFVSNHSKMSARRAGDILSPDETVVLIGGLTFFIAFIIALLTQIRASQTVYQLLIACIMVNTKWRIDQYHRSEDSMYCK